MKKILKRVFFTFFDLIAAYLITWIIGTKVHKYMDYLICNRTEPCSPNMVGCLPCGYSIHSGVMSMEQPYQIAFIVAVIVFFLIFLGFYLFTKKRFKF